MNLCKVCAIQRDEYFWPISISLEIECEYCENLAAYSNEVFAQPDKANEQDIITIEQQQLLDM